jgi:hypothetical protein
MAPSVTLDSDCRAGEVLRRDQRDSPRTPKPFRETILSHGPESCAYLMYFFIEFGKTLLELGNFLTIERLPESFGIKPNR